MDGRMNCHLNAENAAFTKLRYLDNRVSQVEEQLADVEHQVLENTNSFNEHIAQVSEKLETKKVSATSVTANTATFTNTEAGNLNANKITATTIDAETVNVDNLENVNVLHGKTVDVDKTIATIGQFAETHTTEANNTTTNTTELNVSTEANLTGQVNIDGNLTFTKDNGVSKLQGEYLEVDAANVVLNNKTKGGYALYAPGVDGKALFGGSVSVQDTLTAKNLIVVGETLLKGPKLDANTELTNPTFKGIKGTNELTTTALVIDNEGKLVSKKISSEVEGSVASSLVAQRKVITHTLLDEWKPNEGNTIAKIPVSSKAQFVFTETDSTREILLTNENGNQISVKELGVASQDEVIFSVAHKNFVYIIHPTLENETTYKCVVIPINTNTMEVSPSFDITQYLGEISSGDIGESLVEVLFSRTVLQPLACGMVLPDDVPTIGFVGTNNYLDLSTMEIKTRDTAFSSNWCVLSKNGNWIELPGYIVDNNFYCTNGIYLSVENAALGVPASDYIVNPETDQIEKQLYYVDAPVFGMHNEDNLVYIDGGAVKEVALADIGYSNYESIVGTVDKDGNPVCFSTTVIYSGEAYRTNLLLYYGYYPREYFASTTVSYVDTIIIDKNKVEVNGSTFVDGAWYDKVVSSTNALIDFITKPKDKKRYKVLFTGKSVDLDTADTSQVPTSGYSENDIYGTFDIYHINDDMPLRYSLNLNGTPATLTRMNKLLDACHWHGFDTTADILFCSNTSNLGADWVVKYLHINDCYIRFKTNGNAVPQDKFYLGISDSNNVVYRDVDIPTALFTTGAGNKEVDVTLSKCYNVVFNGKSTSSSTAVSYRYLYSQILFDNCDRCESVVNVNSNIISSQYGPGYNFTYNKGAGSGSEFVLPAVKTK